MYQPISWLLDALNSNLKNGFVPPSPSEHLSIGLKHQFLLSSTKIVHITYRYSDGFSRLPKVPEHYKKMYTEEEFRPNIDKYL